MNITKKIVASVVGLSMVVMMAPGVAQGATVEELQAQIAALTAQLAQLQAQLQALTGAAPAVSCTFTRNLYPGISGADVKCLQQYLNSAGYTLAVSGPGSPGNETEYFGSLTRAAVKKWQDANGVVYGAWWGYFGPLSRAKYTALAVAAPSPPVEEVPGITTPGAEGSLIATIASQPPSGVEVYIKTTNVGVAAVDLEAADSDILIKRFDVDFNKRPWLYIKNLTITDGTTSKTVAVTEEDTIEVTVGSDYTVRVNGVNILISKDTEKTLTVKVDGADALPTGTTSQDIIVTIDANAIRGVDGAGVSQYAPTSALSTRTFTAKAGETANIEIGAHADNPKARNVKVESTAETTGVVLAKFKIKATNRDAILRNLKFKDANASNTLKTVYLYDGDTQLSSTSSIGTASSHLTNIDLTIPKDTTKVLTLKADIYKASGNYATADATSGGVASSSITIEANADGFDAEDATTFATATVSGSTVAPGPIYFFQKCPSLTLVSTSINSVSVATGTITYNGKADAKIKINVTAQGGDIYVASTTANDVAGTTTIGASATVVESITSNAETSSGENWIVYSGDTKWFEIYGQLTRVDDDLTGAVGPDLATYYYLVQLDWASTDAGAEASYNLQTWGLTDFKTGSVVLEYFR